MAIPQEEYINITSGVVKDAVSNRELIGRYITPNALFSGALEYTKSDSVGDDFGYNSDEYKFAKKYFDFLSKDIKKPKKISFFKLPKKEDFSNGVATKIIFNATYNNFPITSSQSAIEITYQNIKDGTSDDITIDFSSVSGSITDFEGFVSYVNSLLIPSFVASYDLLRNKIVFTLKTTDPIKVTNVVDDGGFFADAPQVSQGIPTFESWSQALDYMDNSSNNFATFTFSSDYELTQNDIQEIAEWNNSKNVKYMYVCGVSSSSYSIISSGLKGVDGTWLQLVDSENPYACFAPMAIGATLNYNRVNTNAFFDFYPVNGLETQVSDYSTYNNYVLSRVNFNGATQQAGREITFLQPGYLTGAISDAGVYYNEMWLKDDIWTKLMALFLAVKKIPANEVGKIQCKNTIMTSIEQAKVNGCILVGKTLTNAQKAQIQEYTNDDNAVNKIQEDGFYLTLNVERTTFADSNQQDVEKYIVTYSLLYAKGDGIRKVEGTNILY